MKLKTPEFYRGILLNILLGNTPEAPSEADNFDHADFMDMAEKNVCSIRSFEWLEKIGGDVKPELRKKIDDERGRIARTMELIEDIDKALSHEGIACMFPKAMQHYPDMGHDIDILVADESRRSDRAVSAVVHAMKPAAGSIPNYVAGKTSYEIPGFSTSIEIHHARLGMFGEYSDLASAMFARGIPAGGGHNFKIPRAEDALILCVIQRMYAHFCVRVTDAANFILISSSPKTDMRHVFSTAKRYGIIHGLSMFGRLAAQLAARARSAEKHSGGPQVKYAATPHSLRSGKKHYNVSITAAVILIVEKMFSDILARRWDSFFRLCFAPPAFLTAILRKLGRKFSL